MRASKIDLVTSRPEPGVFAENASAGRAASSIRVNVRLLDLPVAQVKGSPTPEVLTEPSFDGLVPQWDLQGRACESEHLDHAFFAIPKLRRVQFHNCIPTLGVPRPQAFWTGSRVFDDYRYLRGQARFGPLTLRYGPAVW